jgi:CBS domain-containing protein
MAKYVHEIMNREVLMFPAEETVGNTLADLQALAISGAPVVDAATKPVGVVSWRDLVAGPPAAHLADRMTSPAVVVTATETIAHAADVLAERGIHRLFVVDQHGTLIGALSIIDVLRALTGKAVRHPAAFPHQDRAGVSWTDDEPFELASFDVAPTGPGVLLLLQSVVGERDDIAFVEAPANVRARLLELSSVPQTDRPDLARLLEHPSRLRFRAAAIDDGPKRDAIARRIRARADRALRADLLR